MGGGAMRFTVGVLGVLLLASSVIAAETGGGGVLKNDPALRPLQSYFRQLARLAPSARPRVLAIGEEHGRPEIRDLYPQILVAARNAGLGMNCVYFEADVSIQPYIQEYIAGRLEAHEVVPQGVRAMFEKWQLVGPNGFFNWDKSANATVQNLNMGSALLQVAKSNGVKVLAIDEQSRTDYLATIFQMLTENMGNNRERARLAMERADLLSELPENPFAYFRDEIVFRRSRKMAERIVRSFETGECTGGILITGALHVMRKVAGGQRIYRNGGETMLDILEDAGIRSHLISVRVTSFDYRFRNVPLDRKPAFFLLGPHNYEHEWPSTWEEKATLLVYKYN